MKYGIISLDYKLLPLEMCFSLAAKYRFDGVEIFGCRKHMFYKDVDEAFIYRLSQLRDTYKLEVPMYTPCAIGLPLCLASNKAAEREDGIAYFTKAIEAAAKTQIPRVLVVADHPGMDANKEDSFHHFADSIYKLTRVGEREGIKIVVEPLTPQESPVITTALDCANLIREINSPALCAMLDVAVPTVVGERMENYFELLGDRLEYVHICNSNGITDAHFRLDKGVLQMKDVFSLLDRYKYQGYVTSELYSETDINTEKLMADTSAYIDALRRRER